MTKQMFIHELKVALAGVNDTVREEIIADISEHFIEGTAQGMSEGEICRSLGQPSSIAAQVLEEMGAQVRHNAPPPLPHTPRHNAPPLPPAPPHPAQSWTTKDVSFTGISAVNIDVQTCGVAFVPSPNGEFRVVVDGENFDYENFVMENRNGTLLISYEPKSQKKFMFFSFGRINNGNSSVKVMVHVPAQFVGEIKVRTAAGSVSAEGVSGKFNFKTAAGGIKIDDCNFPSAVLESAAGSVKVRAAGRVIEDLHISSSAGSVSLEAAETHNLRLSTAAGKANVNVGKLVGKTKISTAAGGVTLTTHEIWGKTTISSALGGVNVNMPRDIDCRISYNTSGMSRIKGMQGNNSSENELKINISMGSINVNAL